MERGAHAVGTFVLAWYHAKMFVEHALAFSHDAIHVFVGGLGLIAIAFVTRRTIADWLPWLAMFALTLVNEGVDLMMERWPDASMQYGEGFKDILLTMTLPTVMMLTARMLPQLYVRPPVRDESTPPPPADEPPTA